MKTTLINLVIIILFLQGSCQRIEFCPTYRLPKATHIGTNTIGCKVNGKVCIPKSSGIFSPKTKKLCYNEETGSLRLTVYFIPNDKDFDCGFYDLSVRVNADSIFSTGEVAVINLSASVSITEQYQRAEEYIYGNDLQNLSIKLEITKLDIENQIISGLFLFEGYLHLGLGEFDFSQKAYVTDGRFDFTYNSDGSCVEGYSN